MFENFEGGNGNVCKKISEDTGKPWMGEGTREVVNASNSGLVIGEGIRETLLYRSFLFLFVYILRSTIPYFDQRAFSHVIG